MSDEGKTPLPPAQWFVDPDYPTLWRWWDGERWTEHCAPRKTEPATGSSPPTSTDSAQEPAKHRSRFMRELVGSKQERAEARAERLQAKAVATAGLRSALRGAEPATGRVRTSHQTEALTVQRMLAELALEDPRHPLDEQVEVAGETYHIAGIKKVYRSRGLPITERGLEMTEAPCVLVPEPWNPHDANAVAVVVEGHQVGHLPAETAMQYAGPLAQLASSGYLVTGVARVWAKDDGGGVVRARVTILIPEASSL